MKQPRIYAGLVLALLACSPVSSVRVCVTAPAWYSCESLNTTLAQLDIVCIPAQDRYTCLLRLAAGEADVMLAQPEDLYLAHQLAPDTFHVVAAVKDLPRKDRRWRYEGVAVVRRKAITSVQDLRGSKSCHTGYGRTAGWNIPVAHLLKLGELKMECDFKGTVAEHDLRAASKYFGLACVPGQWAPDNDTDAQLKEQYSNLCTMCRDPGLCDGQDAHAGYEGVLRCLVDSHGDVAWTKREALTAFLADRTDVVKDDFALLCPDGRLVDVDSHEQCHWAARPWPVWLATEQGQRHAQTLQKAMAREEPKDSPLSAVMGSKLPAAVQPVLSPTTASAYLQQAGYEVTISGIGCNSESVILCVSSKAAEEKCRALSKVLKSRRVRPELKCTRPSSSSTDNCINFIVKGKAHITSVDGGDMFDSHVKFGTTALISERYGPLDASYFAVAVVKADSGITSLEQLKGKKSCHTGIGRTAGWKIPVSTLMEAGLLKPIKCNYAQAIGKFFSSSCVPGAKNVDYDPSGTNPRSLCELCVGSQLEGAVDGPPYDVSGGDVVNKCARDDTEAFSGYTGAFRCLVQGGGDVAFVKHTTVIDNTNGNNNESWAKNLNAQDFKLLCRNSSTADVVSFSSCYLASVPAHKVITAVKNNDAFLDDIRLLLLRASAILPPGQDVFTLFGPFMGKHDLIFKDSATALINLRQDKDHQTLEGAYFRALKELHMCHIDEDIDLLPESQEIGQIGSNASHAQGSSVAILCLTLLFSRVVVQA
ncbi:transferrin-like [Oratosquilla oratoria]|uniref:transferrin-like n=1 Tax=Oratosquilla oratoria TaxID=337810 RepID=UPI003F77342E